MFHTTFCALVASIVILSAFVVLLKAETAQVVDICTICRCLEDVEEATVIVECFGKSAQHQRGSQYLDLRNIMWPVAKNAASDPPKVRAFFRDLELQYLPKLPTSSNVVELHFKNDSIKSLLNEPFNNFQNLEKLSLANNNLGIIEKDFFATQNKLVHLDLSDNSLTAVSALERARFEKLESINLSHNKLKAASIHLTRALQNASIVLMENCEIYNWDSGIVLRWKQLNLNWNKLAVISTSTFVNLQKLEALYLSHNEIHVIEPLAFENLDKLERLDLSHNSIMNLAMNLILPAALEVVSIANNGIERWPFGKIPSSLRILEIQHNELSDLSTSQAANVLILNVSYNRLETFYGDSFPELTELDISFNSLTVVPFKLGKQLLTLILDGNPLNQIFFDSEISLKLLSLNRMPELTELGAFSFWKLDGVEASNERDCVEVRISNCPKLRHIDPMAFDATSLCKLDISFNQLTSISQNLVDWKSVYDGFNLQGNPWDCSCSEQWLVDDILPLLYERKDLQYLLDNWRCATPGKHGGKRLVKFLNHKAAFCGGPKMERLQMAHSEIPVLDRTDAFVQAGFANFICSDDDEDCLRAHEGLGLVILGTVCVVTVIVSIILMIIIVKQRRKKEQKRTADSVWLMNHNKKY